MPDCKQKAILATLCYSKLLSKSIPRMQLSIDYSSCIILNVMNEAFLFENCSYSLDQIYHMALLKYETWTSFFDVFLFNLFTFRSLVRGASSEQCVQ